MNTCKRLLAGLFAVCVFIAAVAFVRYNSTPVALGLGDWQSPFQAVSVWVLGAFVCGGLLGLLAGLRVFRELRHGSRARKLARQLAAAQREIAEPRGSDSRGGD